MMNEKPRDRLLPFWTHIMEVLDHNDDPERATAEALQKLCMFFEFGCGFVYEANHTGVLILRECYAAYQSSHAQKRVDITALLGASLLAELSDRMSVICNNSDKEGALEKKLCVLFQAASMVLIPVTDRERKLVALVGAVDRRGETRLEDIDVAYSVSILRSVAAQIKMRMYRASSDMARLALMSTLDNLGAEVCVSDFSTYEVLYANKTMAETYGGPQNIIGRPCSQMISGGEEGQCDTCPKKNLLDEKGKPAQTRSWEYFRPLDGKWLQMRIAAFSWVDGRLAHIMTGVDITESKKNEELVRRMAEYDALTGLPNRRRLQLDLDDESGRDSTETYLFFIDLDGFKAVNDTLGHRYGDELLRQIADFLGSLGENGSYRYGGDEFVLMRRAISQEDIISLIERLLKRFDQPWELSNGKTASCRCSIGVACRPRDSMNVDTLLHQADNAMYAAKKRGGSALFFNCGNYCTPEAYFERWG